MGKMEAMNRTMVVGNMYLVGSWIVEGVYGTMFLATVGLIFVVAGLFR